MPLRGAQKVYLPFKRAFDFLFSLLLILLLSPLFIILSIVCLLDTKGFPIFRQKRIGKKNKEFVILKFRSMNVKAPREIPTHLFENADQFISKWGHFMRKSSLDELPQLFNILIGQMSFIGPRPALWNQKDLIAFRTKAGVDAIRPGLSGYAQVHGRDSLSIEKKAELDAYYLAHFSLWLDIKLAFLSLFRALSAKDVIEGIQS